MFAGAWNILLLLASVTAQDCRSDIKVENQADLDAIAACPQFYGNIDITSQGVKPLVLNGVQSVSSISVVDSRINSFSAPSLAEVKNGLTFERLTYLYSLNMPNLTKIGSLRLQTLPELRKLGFDKGIESCSEIVVADTYLQSLDGLNASQVTSFNINNNRNIKIINVGLKSVSNMLDISFNSDKVNVTFPNLETVNNASFRFCGAVNMPQLKAVKERLAFVNNSIREISCPSLQQIGGDMSIVSNSKLETVSFPELSQINGALIVANNTQLHTIDGFPNIRVIRGTLDMFGSFDRASMENLERVEGDVTIESTEEFDCHDFDNAHGQDDFYGNRYVCRGKISSAKNAVSQSAETSSTELKEDKQSKQKNPATRVVPNLLGFATVSALCWTLFFQ